MTARDYQNKAMITKMPTCDNFIYMVGSLHEGTMQKRVQVFSYQCLRRIYFQRKAHRLPHWREFCQWVEGLPLAKELITI